VTTCAAPFRERWSGAAATGHAPWIGRRDGPRLSVARRARALHVPPAGSLVGADHPRKGGFYRDGLGVGAAPRVDEALPGRRRDGKMPARALEDGRGALHFEREGTGQAVTGTIEPGVRLAAVNGQGGYMVYRHGVHHGETYADAVALGWIAVA
jgi:hypothetical protein